MERKVCFISDAGNWWGSADIYPKADSPHTLATTGARAFLGRRRGLCEETAQSALTVIFRLVIGGLTSILVVLGAVNLQFRSPFVSISLRPVLRTVAAYAMATVRSSGS